MNIISTRCGDETYIYRFRSLRDAEGIDDKIWDDFNNPDLSLDFDAAMDLGNQLTPYLNERVTWAQAKFLWTLALGVILGRLLA